MFCLDNMAAHQAEQNIFNNIYSKIFTVITQACIADILNNNNNKKNNNNNYNKNFLDPREKID